ncbi:50S ribosomal protein L21 [Clostridium sediminicola]|uniref:50S ribosomal protein L21 n=1 Tax=Clostridium sediminicola TaxID=3114879 RepID=UPI0031F239D3
MYAVVKTGGKQYKVQEGDVIFVEKLDVDAESTIELNEVLAIGNEGDFKFGTPVVEGAKVTAKVLKQGKNKKVVVFKYRPKLDYRKKNGHRQPYTKLQIEKIEA